MKLSKPKKAIFTLALILAAIAVLIRVTNLPLGFITGIISDFALMTVAFVILALGNLIKGL